MLGEKFIHARILPTRWVPMRALVALMLFTACWVTYVCRLQMPILVVPMMVDNTTGKDSGSKSVCDPDRPTRSLKGDQTFIHEDLRRFLSNSDELFYEMAQDRYRVKRQGIDGETAAEPRELMDMFSNKPYEWSPKIRGQLLAGYAYGNVVGNLLGGVLSIKYGPRKVVLWTSLVSAVISFVTPLISNIHWGALLVSRVIIGLAGGTIFPACHTMVAKWSPPNEKSRFVWSLLGGTFGTIFAYPMVAGIAEYVNWESAWYIPSLLMLLWVFFWAILAYDSPEEHPGITDEEKNYIVTAQAGTVSGAKPSLKETPMKAIFTSVPFLSLIVCHFGNLFLLFFYQNAMMIYLTSVLGFKLTNGGMLAAMPWFGRMFFGYFFSWIADVIKRNNYMSTTALRKSATIFSHLVPGMCLLVVGYVGCSFLLANTFLVLALAFNGAVSIANLSNNQDLAPNYAGFLYGIMNTFGTVAGMIIPPMVEAIAGKYGHPIEKWQILFQINAGVNIISMLIFIIGGSGNIQKWNEGKSRV